jgi:hypothetical protein
VCGGVPSCYELNIHGHASDCCRRSPQRTWLCSRDSSQVLARIRTYVPSAQKPLGDATGQLEPIGFECIACMSVYGGTWGAGILGSRERVFVPSAPTQTSRLEPVHCVTCVRCVSAWISVCRPDYQVPAGLRLKVALQQQLLADVQRTAVLESLWINGTTSAYDIVPIWRYVCTSNTLFRTYPGHQSAMTYNW